MADRLAEETDYVVIVPNFFRDAYDPTDPQSVNWHDFMQVLQVHIKKTSQKQQAHSHIKSKIAKL